VKYLFAICLAILAFTEGRGQSYNLSQLESCFLENNYLLIAARYEIAQAEAEVLQERLWTNPIFTVDEANLWSNASSEVLPPLIGNYGKKQQISVELEQLIETAGKRGKRVAIKQLDQQQYVYAFEETMRELKKELRQGFYRLANLKVGKKELSNVISLFEELTQQYANQSQKQNVSLADYQRIQAELVRLRRESLLLDEGITEAISILQTITGIQGLSVEELDTEGCFVSRTARLPLDLLSLVHQQNIGLKQQATAVKKAESQFSLEKARSKPDLTMHLGYDRGGNIMRDFIGVGVSMELPVFNRNKGNIQAAKESIDKERAFQSALRLEMETAVKRYKAQLLAYENALQDWPIQDWTQQAKLIDNYRRHLQVQQISLMEFIDFVQSAREAKQAFLDLWENYNLTYEELQYLVGNDF